MTSKLARHDGGVSMEVDFKNPGFHVKDLIEAFRDKLKHQEAPEEVVEVIDIFEDFCLEMYAAELWALEKVANGEAKPGLNMFEQDEKGGFTEIDPNKETSH